MTWAVPRGIVRFVDDTGKKKKKRPSRLTKVTVEIDPQLWKWYRGLGDKVIDSHTTTWHVREALRLYKKFRLYELNEPLLVYRDSTDI